MRAAACTAVATPPSLPSPSASARVVSTTASTMLGARGVGGGKGPVSQVSERAQLALDLGVVLARAGGRQARPAGGERLGEASPHGVQGASRAGGGRLRRVRAEV